MPDEPHCDATTPGLFSQLLGPCLNPPGHPAGSWHRDARGTEWREHQQAETTTPSWEQKGDGIWTLPVDGGTVLITTQSTPEERTRFAEEWAKGTKPEADGTAVTVPLADPCADCIAGVHSLNYHRRRLAPPPPSTEEQILGALHELASSVRDLVSALRLETADRSNCATAHDIKGDQ